MEEKSQKPSAEEQNEPQNTENLDQGAALPSQEAAADAIENKEAQKDTPESSSPKKESTPEVETEKEALVEPPEKKEDTADEMPSSSEKNSKKASVPEAKEASPVEETDFSKLNIQELIETFTAISTGDQWLKSHAQLQNINRLFEEKFHADVEANKKAFIDGGGNEIDFFYKPEYKKNFDQVGFEYRKKRRDHYKEQEAAYKINLERKKTIIDEIKGLIGADENINTIYKRFRTLQESWYSTGPVSRAENQNLWETFKHHVERFYDFLHLNRELRELDFKHNYEEKLKIIERAEALKELPDVMRASRDLNTLHQLWKNDLGPVAKEHREALWNRFQEATKVIQTRRQEYQKDVAGAMKENLEKKKTILKEMKNLTETEPQNHNAWQSALKKFNELRATFKSIGYVPSKESKVTWQEFREIGRDFMQKKNVFYKNQKQEYNNNIDAKKDLISKSKAILEDPQWDQMVQQMKTIQKDWKSVGFVPRKLDNKLWAEFSEIHKTFFDRIKSGYQHLSPEQEALQNEKTAAVEALRSKQFSEEPEQLLAELTESWENWNAMSKIGGQTELELNKKFTIALSQAIGKVSLDKKAEKEVQFKLNAILLQNDPNKLQKEFNEIKSTLSKLKTERTQLENNLEFFSHSSSENPLFKNVEKQIESCQNKIDKAQEEYIRLKQIKNAQIKLANQEAAQEANESEEGKDSKED
ncbi:DUF349 domain-containing protein [Flavobacteriaceae bacterium]|nr:DUF349 domain-containing protein [Flavobacteriaceae bacterium]MDA9015845.1 DUF349 domain-containing protein [Flavobacteriaceae bacterium]MDB3862812.1 DUF349 domain-containing protein [Flavobacteriaceae bacterium]MDC3354538.1 DUF349 domain-containing protein [Flavobacteriaceae bacterium]